MEPLKRIDLNADLGESYGVWRMGRDDAVLQWVTSANVACGFHAGDPDVMAATVALAAVRGVAIGAHPALPDRQGFGRRAMALRPDEIRNLVLYQLGALSAFTRAVGARLHHVKPHGALYNQAAADPAVAMAIATAVRDFGAELILVGLAGSALLEAGLAAGLEVAAEGFADRRYEADGSLTPRRFPDALIDDPEEALAQVLDMVEHRRVVARDGTVVPIAVDTVGLHGDGPTAVDFARYLRQALEQRGIRVEPLGRGGGAAPGGD